MRVEIVEGPIVTENVLRIDGAGAIVRFEGIVRPNETGRPIEGLEYEVYSPMAERMLKHRAEEAMDRFNVLACHVVHSRGWVPNGACSFLLQIAAHHRAESFAALAWFIDEMKSDVPIWKRPRFVTTEAPTST